MRWLLLVIFPAVDLSIAAVRVPAYLCGGVSWKALEKHGARQGKLAASDRIACSPSNCAL